MRRCPCWPSSTGRCRGRTAWRRAAAFARCRPSRLVYVILLTARTAREDVIRGLKSGADDYITKPCNHEDLYARIQVGTRMLRLQQNLSDRVRDLEAALASLTQLQGLLPMCCYCKSIRNDQNYWEQVEHYIGAHSELQFSHGICPSCYAKVVEPQVQEARQEKETLAGGMKRGRVKVGQDRQNRFLHCLFLRPF